MATQNKVILGAASALTILLIGGASMSAFAQGNPNGDTLVDKIASKFSLNKDEVKAVFDEERQAHEEDRRAERDAKLQSKVNDGTITAEQKAAIEQKEEEMHTARDETKTSLDEWASQNNIDAKYVMMRGGQTGGKSDRLQKAVDDGSITAEQKALIEQKQQEIKANFESKRDAMQKWAEENGIDNTLIAPKGPGMGGNNRLGNR